MPVTITLPDEITFNIPDMEPFTHALAGHTPAMIVRGFAHGMRQMLIDSRSITREDMAEMSVDEITAWKRNKVMTAFANRLAWLRTDPRAPSDDVVFMREADPVMRALQIGAKVRATLKTVAAVKAAILAAAGPIAGESYCKGLDKVVAAKKAALADPTAALAALAALAADDIEAEAAE